MRSATPAFDDRGDRVAAADDRRALHAGDRLGDRVGARWRTRRSRTRPSGPFQTTVFAVRDQRGVRLGRLGTDVEAHAVADRGIGDRQHVRRRAGFELRRDDVIGGQRERDPGRRGALLELPRLVEQIVLDQRLADRDAARLQEGVGHRPADAERVDLAEEVLDHLELVRDLGAADDRHERAIRVVQRLAEVGDLGGHQQAGRGHRHVRDDALGRGVGAVRRAERVVDVDVDALGELLGEAGVVLLLFRVEAQVLEQHDAGRAGGGDCRADAVVGEGDGRAQELGQPRRDRPQAQLGVRARPWGGRGGTRAGSGSRPARWRT